MAAVNEQQVAGLELERVLPKVTTVYERDDMFYSSIKKRDVEVISNRLMRVPLELQPGGNFGYYNPSGGDLGRGSGPVWDKATLNSVWVREAFEYTKLSQWSTDNDRKAVVNAVRKMTADALLELRRQLDSQLMQPGTGVIGVVDAITANTGYDSVTLANTFGARLMRPQQIVQVFDTTLATLRGSATITQWDVENGTIELTPNVAGLTATDVIVTDGISDPTSLPALYGVPYHHSNASTGVWLGLNRATNPEIRSNAVDGNNNALSLPLPRLAINKIGNRVGIDKNFKPKAWMHPCQKQAYEEIGQLVSMIWKEPKEQSLDMYFDKMQMAGAPVVDDFNWNKTRIDFINEDVWGRGESLPIGFYKVDGRSIFEIRGASGGVATSDIFYMTVGFQTFVTNPAATAYIHSLAVPDGY